jgi:hypothetical protein
MYKSKSMNDVLRNALAEAQKRIGLGSQDGEGVRELASVCVRSKDDGRTHKKKRGNPPVDDDDVDFTETSGNGQPMNGQMKV